MSQRRQWSEGYHLPLRTRRPPDVGSRRYLTHCQGTTGGAPRLDAEIEKVETTYDLERAERRGARHDQWGDADRTCNDMYEAQGGPEEGGQSVHTP